MALCCPVGLETPKQSSPSLGLRIVKSRRAGTLIAIVGGRADFQPSVALLATCSSVAQSRFK